MQTLSHANQNHCRFCSLSYHNVPIYTSPTYERAFLEGRSLDLNLHIKTPEDMLVLHIFPSFDLSKGINHRKDVASLHNTLPSLRKKESKLPDAIQRFDVSIWANLTQKTTLVHHSSLEEMLLDRGTKFELFRKEDKEDGSMKLTLFAFYEKKDRATECATVSLKISGPLSELLRAD